VLKFAPPSEARTCRHPRWRVYVFKDLPPGADGGDDEGGGGGKSGDERGARTKGKKNQQPVGDPIALDRYPYYLFGKERRVADIPTDHPSCSRQHAVVCFREVERLPEGGLLPSAGGAAGTAAAAAAALAASRQTLPYLIDLETANGTFLNGERIEASRFYEVLDGDVVKFGASTREYVFIRER
jgi:pSer/pThr/pTyr-binding forkhead associated (FHA) protein